ncbi:MAG: hypothetical protein IJ065_07145 [Eubacterium sp.]|nr:hypothetical protein [Eubacterium sp.]
MKKKRLLLVCTMIIILSMNMTVFAANGGYINSWIYGSVVAQFSGNYGCYSGTISAKDGSIIKLVGYKGPNNNKVGEVAFTANQLSRGFNKDVGSATQIKASIIYNGNTALSDTAYR